MVYTRADESMLPDAFAGRISTQTITAEFLEHAINQDENDVDRIRYAIKKAESMYNVVGGFVYNSGNFHVFFVHKTDGEPEAAGRAAQELFHWIDK